MAYALSFAEAFFWGDGTVPPEELPPARHPTSVYQAVKSMPATQWADLAREVFGVEPDLLDIDTVLAKVISTDTCGHLDSPVDVWIDPEGFFTIHVYERKERP